MPNVLSAEQVEHYNRDGYVAGIQAMPPAEVVGIRRRIEALKTETGKQFGR